MPGDRGYAAIRRLPGIGPVLGAVIAAEIGDITRFRTPGPLCSWAGLTPRHYECTRVIRGHVSEQGSRMLRWAFVEAIQRQPAGTRPRQVKDAIIARRGDQARGMPRAINRLATTALLAACTAGKTIADESSARTAIAEDAAAATD